MAGLYEIVSAPREARDAKFYRRLAEVGSGISGQQQRSETWGEDRPTRRPTRSCSGLGMHGLAALAHRCSSTR
jgi:hypothetical protein